MKRPLVCLTVIFCLGIFFSNFTKIYLPLFYSLVVVFLILIFLSVKKDLIFEIFLFCLVFLLGIVSLKNSQNLSKRHISKFVYYKNEQPYIVKGIIDSQPILKGDRASFIFKVETIQSDNLKYACCGNIIVYLKGKKELNYGEELILKGNLYKPFGKIDSRRQSYRDYLYNQNIWFIMNVKSEADAVKINQNRGFILKRFALWLKQKIENIVFQHTSYLTASILDAMVLGEKRNIPWFVNNAMMKSGTIHILVVSGFNVGIVAFIIILFLKLIRLPRKIRIGIAILCLIIYCLITGASTPVVRATVMASFFLFAYLLKREPDIYNSCAVAALFILMIEPRQLFDIGFQLSFVSVGAIAYLYPKLKSFLRIELIKTKSVRFLLDGCIVSFSAWLATSGFIAYYFKIFSPITVLANIFIVPLATLITLCGFSLIFISLIFPALAPFFASTTELAVLLLLKINVFLVKLPAAYFYL